MQSTDKFKQPFDVQQQFTVMRVRRFYISQCSQNGFLVTIVQSYKINAQGFLHYRTKNAENIPNRQIIL